MAPLETRAVIYKDAVNRTSWGPRGIDAWYCGPAFKHYQCCKCYIPETISIRISRSYDLYSQHYIMLMFTPEQHAVEVTDELQEAVANLDKNAQRK